MGVPTFIVDNTNIAVKDIKKKLVVNGVLQFA